MQKKTNIIYSFPQNTLQRIYYEHFKSISICMISCPWKIRENYTK